MSINFRKKIKILPGISLNLSKSGVSTSLQAGPISLNNRRGKLKITAAAHGTGIFVQKTVNNKKSLEAPKQIYKSLNKTLVIVFISLFFLAIIFIGLKE